MKPSGLLFLVIAIIYIPHETSCIYIDFERFGNSSKDSRDCLSNTDGEMAMYLNRREYSEYRNKHIVCQYKCPYFTGEHYGIKRGRKDGSWMMGHVLPLKSCDTLETKHKESFVDIPLHCYTVVSGVYIIYFDLPTFMKIMNCNIRMFLADVDTSGIWPTIVGDHGIKGVSDELRLKGFSEEPHYEKTWDHYCEKFHKPLTYESLNFESVNSVPDIWSKTDVLLMLCGVAMANAVLSF